MASLSLETRKKRLLVHIYDRILQDENIHQIEWIDVLDAMLDVMNGNTEGMKEWTITKDCELIFK